MVQPALNVCPDARDATEAKILVLLAEVVAAIRFHRPDAPYPELESRVYRSLGFDPLMIEGGPFLATPLLDRIRAVAAPVCGTEAERVKFLDWLIARAINIPTRPAHQRAMQAAAAAPLDRHELTGAEVSQVTFAADMTPAAPAPGQMERGRRACLPPCGVARMQPGRRIGAVAHNAYLDHPQNPQKRAFGPGEGLLRVLRVPRRCPSGEDARSRGQMRGC